MATVTIESPMPFQGDRRVLQQMIQVLLISEKYGCKVILGYFLGFLYFDMVSDYMFTTGHYTNRNQQFNNHCCFICPQVTNKKTTTKNKKWSQPNFTVFVESQFMPNRGHLFNASSVTCHVCCISHGYKVVDYCLVVVYNWWNVVPNTYTMQWASV